LDAVLGELLLEEAFILEQHRHRVVSRPVDVDLLGIFGGTKPRGGKECECKRAGPQQTAGEYCHDDLHALHLGAPWSRERPLMKAGVFGPPSAWRGAGPALLLGLLSAPQLLAQIGARFIS